MINYFIGTIEYRRRECLVVLSMLLELGLMFLDVPV